MDHEANRQMVKDSLGVEATFDMKIWRDYRRRGATCGTIACIGGTATILMEKQRIPASLCGPDDFFYGWREVADWMGLPHGAADELFHGKLAMTSSVTVEEAYQAIDNTVEFGDPKWEEILDGS